MNDRRRDALARFAAVEAKYKRIADPLLDSLVMASSMIEVDKVLPLVLRDELQTSISRCRSLIRAAKPYRACPYCYGVEAIKGTCRPCRGEGWVTKNVWQLCEANVKAELEGAAHAG